MSEFFYRFSCWTRLTQRFSWSKKCVILPFLAQDVEMVVETMAQTGKEPTFCMGNVPRPPQIFWVGVAELEKAGNVEMPVSQHINGYINRLYKWWFYNTHTHIYIYIMIMNCIYNDHYITIPVRHFSATLRTNLWQYSPIVSGDSDGYHASLVWWWHMWWTLANCSVQPQATPVRFCWRIATNWLGLRN